MKQVVYFILLLTLQFQVLAQRKIRIENIAPPSHALKINVLSGFVGTLNISYEYRLTQKWSIQNGLCYTQMIISRDPRKPYSTEGFQYLLDVRKYTHSNGLLNGRYHQYFLRYSQFINKDYIQDSLTKNKPIAYTENLHGITLGWVYGYQKTYQNKYLIDVFCGIGISVPTCFNSSPSKDFLKPYKVRSFESNPYTNGVNLRMGLKVGYLF
ncbi:MAG: hypothetical protein CFE21_14180 [Bacteroidetes bacterium B1(2017)]|nr:MAG: hypothetical protein CFE21_14180 [Bacteroidetes bacterium B1(2017)]